MTSETKKRPASDTPLQFAAGVCGVGSYLLSREYRKHFPLERYHTSPGTFWKTFDHVQDASGALIVGELSYAGLKRLTEKHPAPSFREQVTAESKPPSGATR